MSTADPSYPDSDTGSENPNPNPTINSNSSDSLNPNLSGPPIVCFLRFAGDSAAGAFMGSIFGYGSSSRLYLFDECASCLHFFL